MNIATAFLCRHHQIPQSSTCESNLNSSCTQILVQLFTTLLTLAVVQPPLIFLSLISLLLISMHTSNLRGNCLCVHVPLLSAGSLQLVLLVVLLLFVCAIICFPCCLLLCLEEDFEEYSGTVCTMALCVYSCIHTAPTSTWCSAVDIRWYITKSVPIIVITRNIITTWIIRLYNY